MMSAGTLTTGAVLSSIVIVKVSEPVLLCESVAEQLTRVTPSGKVSPELLSQVTGTGPSIVSVAPTPLQEAEAPAPEVASVVTSSGTLTSGAVVSWMTMSRLP
jgi:hypothetical protein